LRSLFSSRALAGLKPDTRAKLEAYVDLIVCNVDTIERIGGGGIRCMLAGIYLPNN